MTQVQLLQIHQIRQSIAKAGKSITLNKKLRNANRRRRRGEREKRGEERRVGGVHQYLYTHFSQLGQSVQILYRRDFIHSKPQLLKIHQ